MPAAQASAAVAISNAATSAAPAPASAETATRLPNTTASLPIVYGSIAFYLGKKADELQTHEWTLFLRGPNKHEDHLNSLVISKVVFQLHPSFAQPIRELTEPPYEVTERGWGEFEAQIRIHWKDPSEQTTIVNHTIKLYPQGSQPTGKNDLVQQSTEEPVVAETYDEVVFTEPSESFFRSLTQITAIPPDANAATEEIASFAKGDDKKSRTSKIASSSWKEHLNTVYSDEQDFLALIAAQKFLKDELAGVRQKFQLVTDELGVVDQKLLLAQQQKQREAAAAAVRGSTGERKRTKKRSVTPTPANKKSRTTAGAKSATPNKRGTAKTTKGTTKTPTKAVASKKGASTTPTAGAKK